MTEDNNKPVMEIDDYGDKYWWLNGNLHREDGPAVEFADGDNYWLLNGKRHREDGPAIEYADGSKEWWLNDELHREDGPAIEWADGDKEWYLNGKLHKAWYLNDKEVTKEEVMGSKEEPTMEIDKYGNKTWFLNDKLHREGGPAIELVDGDKTWYLNGKLHRVDGPAVEHADGNKYWYLNGEEVTEEEVMSSKEEPIMEIDDYGNKVWKLNGKIHREDGPAIEFANGDKWCLNEESPYVRWYFKGKEIKK